VLFLAIRRPCLIDVGQVNLKIEGVAAHGDPAREDHAHVEFASTLARDADGADVIAVVDPNRHVLTFLSRVVTERQLAGEVVTAYSGMDFLTLFVERLAAAQPVRLAILGTPMPHLDGLSTALAMRAIERGFPRHEPTPIVFLYPAWTDDPLRGLISLCQPALYLSREGNPEESRLGERINQAVNHLLGLRAV